MPAFSFDAIDDQGQSRKGMIDADTARSARALLRAQGLVPLSVESVQAEADATASRAGLWRRRAFNSTGLTIWTRQLAGLITAGLPIERALAMLADEAEDERQQRLVAALRAEVNAGTSFARALAAWPREFSEVYVAVVGAGEQSGDLGMVLERLADELENRQALQSQVVGAALYPAIVTGVGILIVTFLLSYVVPQVASVFSGGNRSLPLLTEILMRISALLRQYGWWLLAALVLAALVFRWWLRIPSQRERFDAAWLRLPVLGRLAAQYNAARFASTLAMLSGAGVPILKALQAAAETVGNLAMRRDAMEALVLVREGAPLAAALGQKKRYPALLAMFARLGEQTGQLPLMLERAARQMQGEVQRRAVRMATLLEPLLIVAMGVAVMIIVLAVLLPIIQMNQWVR
ncbi:type II secretion system protein GspF [Corticibacter populi]|uniref:Type II secretion system protein GspF n=1 Tax=Corticibacter populi TaxID=1550736 RepID=A0A3M6QYI5_9BURK|nr:type II secretion system inner membrane protein GspF [Corticibacter populi]RMX08080.1 type II secretion system protein GspF [Corticibacter populi]RZS35328.1 general secretion pathway protein F [Corticibacter populi]